MTAHHTPGPWRIWRVTKDRWEICEPEKSHRHSHFASVSVGNMWGAEGMANAQLIAAAPEMLEALEAAHRMIEKALPKFNWGASSLDANAITLLNNALIMIHRALQKAKGEK